MRVLSVIITPPTYRASGGVSAGLRLAQELAELVDMKAAIMADHDGESERGRLTVKHFRCTSVLGPLAATAPGRMATPLWKSRIPAYIRESRPDLVHVHNPFPARALLDVMQACRRAGIPCVISSHGFVELSRFAESFNHRGLVRFAAKILVQRPFLRSVRLADRVFILSPLESDMVTTLGVPPARQLVVTNGVDESFAEPVSPEVRAGLEARLGWKTDVTNLLFVGNLTHNKGIDILLRAMNEVRGPVRLIVAGSLRSPEQASELLRETGTNADPSRIVFTDHVSFDELRCLYQMVDVFVFPSRADTLPLVVLEAMVSGLPVIASDVGGIPYQLDEGAGITFPSGDHSALARAIDRVAADRGLQEALSTKSRARIKSHFSWRRSAEIAMEGYAELLSAHQPRN